MDFLDSVLESTRAKENAVKEETAEQLEAFRKQRLLAEQSLVDADAQHNDPSGDAAGSDAWAIKKKKRRRDQDRTTSAESTNVNTKLRKLSSTATDDKHERVESDTSHLTKPPVESIAKTEQQQTATRTAPAAGLGLGGYSSDEDD